MHCCTVYRHGALPSDSPGVEEDEFHIQTGPEHERVAVHLDLCDGGRGQRVTDSHQAVDLVTAAIWRAVHAHQLHLGVAAAVDGLGGGGQVRSVAAVHAHQLHLRVAAAVDSLMETGQGQVRSVAAAVDRLRAGGQVSFLEDGKNGHNMLHIYIAISIKAVEFISMNDP